MGIINEIGDTAKGRQWLGAVRARAMNRRDRANLNAEIPRSERKKEARKQQDIMDRATDSARRNSNTSEFRRDQQLMAGADKFYRKNDFFRGSDDDWDDDFQNESKNVNKKLIRLSESDLHRIIKESVNEVLNELGDSDRIHNYLGTISGYYEAQGNRDKANRAFNLSNRLQKNRNNGQLYDPNSEESASEYRRNSCAYTDGFDKGWDKGRLQNNK